MFPLSISNICLSRMTRGRGPPCERWASPIFKSRSVKTICFIECQSVSYFSSCHDRGARLQHSESSVPVASACRFCNILILCHPAAVEEMEQDLPATPAQFSLSISVFILIQGVFPLVWSAISEVKGRKVSYLSTSTESRLIQYLKLVYVSSLALFTVGSIMVALSKHIAL